MIQNNYVVIQGWMITDLKLSGNELMAYGVIYGFSQDGIHRYTGSLKYLSNWLGCTTRTCINVLNSLCKKGLIDKREKRINNVKVCSYSVLEGSEKNSPPMKRTTEGSEKISQGVVKKFHEGSEKISHNNTNDNIYNNIYNKAVDSEKSESLKSDFKIMTDIWFETHKKLKGFEPNFNGKDGKHLKDLIKKILKMDPCSLHLPENFKAILLAGHQDKWIKQNFTLPIINSKYDIIYGQAKQKLDSTAERYARYAD